MRQSKYPSDEPKEDKEVGSVTESLSKVSIDTEEENKKKELPPLPSILSSLDIEGIANYIKTGKAKRIIVMTGAGVSVKAGIPDFRTPGTGLYYNLAKYNLPNPTAVFDIDYFMEKPEAFYLLAKELYPGNFVPTHAHYFIRLLHEKGFLLRNYTQNIDTLERIANIPPDALVEAHGSFGTAHCIKCNEEYSSDFVKEAVFSDKIPKCTSCNGLVKPDIVFFGEGLPSRFFNLLSEDFPECDLLIVIGTSLKVQPFASLIKKVSPTTPRLLINMEEVGKADIMDFIMPAVSKGFLFDHANNIRDVKHLGCCQEGVKKLADLLGWRQELEDLVARESAIVLANAPKKTTTATSSPKTEGSDATSEKVPEEPSAPALAQSAVEPTQSSTASTQSTIVPAPSTTTSTQSTTVATPSKPVSAQPTTEPAQTTTESAPAVIAPAQSSTKPAPAVTAPAQSTTEPAQSTTEPAQTATTPATENKV